MQMSDWGPRRDEGNQFRMPVLAAYGGDVFPSEMVSLRCIAASGPILGGVALTSWKCKA